MTALGDITPEDIENAFFEICKTKEELRMHMIAFLDIDLPDQILDEDSTSTPMQFIWEVYQYMTTGKGKSRHVVAASRNGYKTLSTSILQFYSLIHCRRDSVQISAQIQQSQQALAYTNQFLKRPESEKYTGKDNSKVKTLTGLPANSLTPRTEANLKIVTATKSGVNSSRSSCLAGKTLVPVYTNEPNNGKGRYSYRSMDGIYRRFKRGETIYVSSVDPTTLKMVDKKVLAVTRRAEDSRLVITTESGHTIECTDDHKIPVDIADGEFICKPAGDLVVGEHLFIKAPGADFSANIPPRIVNTFDYKLSDFDASKYTATDVIEGSLLGDGCIFRKNQNKYKGNAHFCMTKTPKVRKYLEFIKSKLDEVSDNVRIAGNAKSGYTGLPLDRITTGQSEYWTKIRDRWYVDGKKIVPKDLVLTKPMLAILIMDDGAIDGHISTYSFSKEDCEVLCKKINDLMGFECAVTGEKKKKDKIYNYVRLGWDGHRDKYYDLMGLIHPCYRYKIENREKKCRFCSKLIVNSSTTSVCNDLGCFLKQHKRVIRKDKIVKIEHRTASTSKRERWVYDIQVEGTHVFFAQGILVHNCLIYDETDLVPREVLGEAAYIADVERFTGFNPVSVYISSRKTNDGPLQNLIDEFEQKSPSDLQLHKWSMVDTMEACPPEIHKPGQPAKAYMSLETLEVIWGEEAYNVLTKNDKAQWKEIDAYEGCKSCDAFIACQGRSVKQKQNKGTLKNREFIAGRLRDVMTNGGPGLIVSQALNIKPDVSSLVFKNFTHHRNVKQPIEFYKWVYGQYYSPNGESQEFIESVIESEDRVAIARITPSKQDIYNAMVKSGWIIHYGVDWGLYDPAVLVIVGFHKATRRTAFLSVDASTGYANEDWAKYIKEAHYLEMPCTMVCPDMADPNSPTYFGRLKMPCRSKKPARIEPGVQQLRSFIYDPFTKEARLMVLDDGPLGQNKMLIEAFQKWTHKKTATGFDFSSFEDNEHCHVLDASRYALDPFITLKAAKISSGQTETQKDLMDKAAKGDEAAAAKLRGDVDPHAMLADHLKREFGINVSPAEKTAQVQNGKQSSGLKFKF